MRTVRAAGHVHSDWSYDATWKLGAIADSFARRGYDLVLMSEHDRGFDESRWKAYRQACVDASNDRILLVPGIEYEDGDSAVHIPVWGEEMPFLGERQPTIDLLRTAHAAGGFAVFAHPARRDALSRYRPDWQEYLGAVEVWNRHYDGIAPYPRGRQFAEAQGLPPFVSLDFHTRRQFFPLAMLIDVDEPLSTAAVAAALRAGRFRPQALRVDALHFTHGLPATTLHGLELLRRQLRGPVRKIERRFRR